MRAFCNICSDFHMKKTGMSIHILIIIECHVHNRKRKKRKPTGDEIEFAM